MLLNSANVPRVTVCATKTSLVQTYNTWSLTRSYCKVSTVCRRARMSSWSATRTQSRIDLTMGLVVARKLRIENNSNSIQILSQILTWRTGSQVPIQSAPARRTDTQYSHTRSPARKGQIGRKHISNHTFLKRQRTPKTSMSNYDLICISKIKLRI